ncbi:Uncharacterized conserved protein YgbK, DUF1537 family [Spirosomataceae bacterium TFI 002]|nr:Uncharacterized conserved protein YgbK, DUF1537 family [Spirosomataceae bacterium TFI 002]
MDSFIQTYLADHFDFHLKARSGSLLDKIKRNVSKNHIYIILDDDPTGTQTVHDIDVYTSWDNETLTSLFNSGEQIAFILTNSRALTEPKAVYIAREIGRKIKRIAAKTGKSFTIVSRGDSTLRGHFPAEVDCLLEELGQPEAIKMIVPAFFPGGRYTFNDIHYVKEGETLIPVAETPFAKDKSFGFSSSNLRNWVIEKYKGQIEESQVHSISLEQIRTLTLKELSFHINKLPNGSSCIVNATEQTDLEQFVKATQFVSRQVFFRTAASLVPILIGQKQSDLLKKKDFQSSETNGSLIVVGSYVPKTTSQLRYLMKKSDIETLEIDVNQLFGRNTKVYLDAKINYCSTLIEKGRDVVIFTSRDLKFGGNQKRNLKIGKTISTALVSIVSGLQVKPKTIIAKGGITSSDIATKALKIKKARVLGQILPGVPVLQFGENQKYIVFPGNVGDDTALYLAYKKI